jgi:hypothetical protein
VVLRQHATLLGGVALLQNICSAVVKGALFSNIFIIVEETGSWWCILSCVGAVTVSAAEVHKHFCSLFVI